MSDFGAIWTPAAQGNYDASRAPVNLIVDHHTAATFQSALARFTTPGTQVSAHFIVDLDGTKYQCVDINATAYHSGDYSTNQRSIGIEHVSVDAQGNQDAFTDVQYAASGVLHQQVADYFGFPLDLTHVCPHSQIVATQCPGSLDINRIIQEVFLSMLVIKTDTQGDPLSDGVWFVDASGKRLVTEPEWGAVQQMPGFKLTVLPIDQIKAIPDAPQTAPALSPISLPISGGTINFGG